MTVEIKPEHLKLVHTICRRHYHRLPDRIREELIGAGMLGLAQAATRYNPNSAATFHTYAHWRIRGAMIDHLRANGRRSYQPDRPTRTPILTADHRVLDHHAGHHTPIHAWEQRETLEWAISTLDPRAQAVIRLHHLHDHTLKQTGLLLGITETHACRIARDARARLALLIDRDTLAA